MLDARILIVSYEVIITRKIFKILKKNNKIRYQLWYLIDKDQFYYEKIIDGKSIDYHHTKQNMAKSIDILEKTYDRFKSVERVAKNFQINEIFSLADSSDAMMALIVSIAKDITRKNNILDEY